jgi:tetratricopeptide (TPR) repeat protein
MGDYVAARKHFSQALAIWRDLGDKQGQGIALGNLGQIAGELGQYEVARDHYQEALNLMREVGDRHGEAIDLLNLGIVYGLIGDYDVSQSYYTQALDLFHDVGDRQSEAATLSYRGFTLLDQGEPQAAAVSLEAAFRLFKELDQRQWAARANAGLASAHLALGHQTEAWQAVQAALAEVAMGAQGVEGLPELYFRCAQVLATYGSPDEALDALDRAYKRLLSQADRILDPDLRRDFLTRAPIHAEIVRAYETRSLGPPSGAGDQPPGGGGLLALMSPTCLMTPVVAL